MNCEMSCSRSCKAASVKLCVNDIIKTRLVISVSFDWWYIGLLSGTKVGSDFCMMYWCNIRT